MEVVLRKKGKDTWSHVVKYKNCFDYISPYMTRSGSIHTGLTEADERRLEKALGFDEGKLSRSSRYWDTFCVKLGDREMVLNTEIPWDDLRYTFLKEHRRVATSLADIKPSTDYVLINKEAEAQESNRANRVRRNAIKEFDKMSLEDMRKCLRLYGYKADTMSAELVESKLLSLVEGEPNKFFSKWVDNKTKGTEFVIQQAIAKNIMRKSRNVYYHGTDIVGSSLEDAVAYLDTPANQDLRLSIMSEIESKK